MKNIILVASSDNGLLTSLMSTLKHFGYRVFSATRLAHVEGFILGNRDELAAVIMDSATIPVTIGVIENLQGKAPVISLISPTSDTWQPDPLRLESILVPKNAETAVIASHIDGWHNQVIAA